MLKVQTGDYVYYRPVNSYDISSCSGFYKILKRQKLGFNAGVFDPAEGIFKEVSGYMPEIISDDWHKCSLSRFMTLFNKVHQQHCYSIKPTIF